MPKRTLSQNAILHCWCREISDHLIKADIKPMNEKVAKQIVTLMLGNTRVVFGEKVAMSTTAYKHDDRDLEQWEIDLGAISMEGLLNRIQRWASVDLNLVLESPNEEKLI